MIQELDIDGSLPRDELERREASAPAPPQIRRDSEHPSGVADAPETDAPVGVVAPRPAAADPQAHLPLIAGAGYTAMAAYFYFGIGPDNTGVLQFAIGVSLLVVLSLWFYLWGRKLMDPVRADFLAGVIGILALIVLWQGWDHSLELLVSGILAGVSTLCILKARSET